MRSVGRGWRVREASPVPTTGSCRIGCGEAALAPVFAEADGIGLFLLGVGRDRWAMPEDLFDQFRALKVNVEVARTGTAVSTYNILLGEGRRVAAGLIAVD